MAAKKDTYPTSPDSAYASAQSVHDSVGVALGVDDGFGGFVNIIRFHKIGGISAVFPVTGHTWNADGSLTVIGKGTYGSSPLLTITVQVAETNEFSHMGTASFVLTQGQFPDYHSPQMQCAPCVLNPA